jgi:hypothetical protein
VKAVQLGTVMTHPDYRNKGLSAQLMEKVLHEYEPKCEFIYLFANSSVLNFYPKFGFKRVQEYQVSIPAQNTKMASDIRKLDISNPADHEILLSLSEQRIPVSQTLGSGADQSLLMFYCESYFKDQLYYLPSQDAVAVLEFDGDTLCIKDILSNHTVSLQNILNNLPNQGNHFIKFGFTPDMIKQEETTGIENNDLLFMKPVSEKLNKIKFMFPLLSHA